MLKYYLLKIIDFLYYPYYFKIMRDLSKCFHSIKIIKLVANVVIIVVNLGIAVANLGIVVANLGIVVTNVGILH